jgi:hypothetical protein
VTTLFLLVALVALILVIRPLGVATNYQEILTLAGTTLPKFLGGPGSKFSMINEIVGQDFIFGRLMRRTRMDMEGGTAINFPLQFNRSDVSQWSHPHAKLELKGTKPPTWGTVPLRFRTWGWFKPYAEIHFNRGREQVLLELMNLAKEDVGIDLGMGFEEAFMAVDGNYLHDGSGDDFLLPYGWSYWCTIDGLPINGSALATVAGINPTTQPLWRNNFINPVTSSDFGTRAPISSVRQLRQCLDRMMRMQRFDSIKVWDATQDVREKSTPTVDPDSKEGPKDLFIMTDPGSSIDLREVLFDREDNVGRDQGRARPVYRSIEILDSAGLGVNANGYGFNAAGEAMWVSRGGSYANGLWPNFGEMVLVNTRYFHFATHPLHAPFVKKPYEPEGMFGLGMEGDFWCNTLCRSRRRGLGYIGPYQLLTA